MRLVGLMAAAAVLLSLQGGATAGQPLAVVAAENFYGDVAQQIGGPAVTVASILANPNQDPHEFEASASTARRVADASLVIYSGADYDPWMAKLLSASRSPGRKVIVVADLMDRKPGDNPHLWYDPATMPALAKAIALELESQDAAHKADYQGRLKAFLGSMRAIDGKVAEMRRKHAGVPVTATEPVFGYMAAALGLDMRNASFQTKVMNGTEPSAREIAAFEQDLRTRAVKVLFCNSQVSDGLTARLKRLARESNVPIVEVSETEPPGVRYQAWMMGQLEATEKALAGPGS
ncbi:MAG TPA: zinc ABC transporter substrate-binding protein [Dongiaceae bacterium]|nr:zinc ABC transporter substrate-binding protein [Dongiaceae bacterium]